MLLYLVGVIAPAGTAADGGARVDVVASTDEADTTPGEVRRLDLRAEDDNETGFDDLGVKTGEALPVASGAPNPQAPASPAPPPAVPSPPEPPTENVPEKPSPNPPFTVVYKDGILASTADGNFTFRLDGSIQVDARFVEARPDTFGIRRAQFGAQATLFKYTEFRFQVEFATIDRTSTFSPSRVGLESAYAGLLFCPELKLRAGVFKVPFESEYSYTSDWYTDFLERSWVRRIIPGRDEGVMLHGELWKRVDYQTGLFDGSMNDSGSKNAFDTNDPKDFALHVRFRPFPSRGPALKGLHVGGGYTVGGARGDPIGSISSQETEVTVLRFEPGVSGGERRTRWAAEAYWLVGPVGLKGEYAEMDTDLVRGGAQAELALSAYFVSATWLVTGEEKTSGLIRPRRNFDPGKGGWGSVEIGARLSGLHANRELSVGSDASRPADPLQFTNEVTTLTLGITWRPNPASRVMVNYVWDSYGRPLRVTPSGKLDDGSRGWLVRVQADF
jgi:phosphate-selective porin OprO and OprP